MSIESVTTVATTLPAAAKHAGPAKYTCPMQPEVVQAGPGSCPKCGMTLVPMPSAAPVAPEYTCPMHPEVRSDRPGICPKCGMVLIPVIGGGDDNAELRDMTRRFWVAAILSIPLVALAMPPNFGIERPFGVPPGIRVWLELALGTPVVLWSGLPFFRKFAHSLRNRSPNMYTLIGLGVGLAYTFSLVAVLTPGIFPQEFRESGGRVGTYRGGPERLNNSRRPDKWILCG